ncbi:MAG: MFS transporter, partial [Gammaproteobacteria bacterium]|nr:MFS transporter [Gammaproteobacteria bacterium]
VAGWLTDKLGAVRITRIVGFAYLASMILLAASIEFSGIPWVVVAIVLFGGTHGAMDVSMNGWAAEVERELEKPIMSVFHAMWSVGAALGALTGVMALSIGAAVFNHFCFVAVICTVFFWLIRDAENIVASDPSSADRPLLTLPRGALLLIGFIAFGAALGEGAMVDWSAIYLVTVADASEPTAAYGYTVFSIAMVVFRLSGGWIVSRAGSVNTVRVSGVMAFVGISLCIFSPTVPAILLGFLFMGAGYAIVIPLVFTRAANDAETPPGVALAGVATLSYGGMLLGPPVIGFLAEWFGLQRAYLLLAILAVLSVVLAPKLTQK